MRRFSILSFLFVVRYFLDCIGFFLQLTYCGGGWRGRGRGAGGGGQGAGRLREAVEERVASGIPKVAGTGRNRNFFYNIA